MKWRGDARRLRRGGRARQGVAALVASGTVAGEPGALAGFLRGAAAALDKGQLGELLGRPDELAVGAMHAYVDAERYGGLSLDEALRALLQGFRLPGARRASACLLQGFRRAACLPACLTAAGLAPACVWSRPALLAASPCCRLLWALQERARQASPVRMKQLVISASGS